MDLLEIFLSRTSLFRRHLLVKILRRPGGAQSSQNTACCLIHAEKELDASVCAPFNQAYNVRRTSRVPGRGDECTEDTVPVDSRLFSMFGNKLLIVQLVMFWHWW